MECGECGRSDLIIVSKRVHQEAMSIDRPAPGAARFSPIYSYKGKRYEVLGLAQLKSDEKEKDLLPMMIYRREGSAGFENTFVRAAAEFNERFEFVEMKHLNPGGDS